MVERCENLEGLLSAERPELKSHIDRDKDFLKYHLVDWADGFRTAYCGYACPIRERCDVREQYL